MVQVVQVRWPGTDQTGLGFIIKEEEEAQDG
jgi:hypothetical protein